MRHGLTRHVILLCAFVLAGIGLSATEAGASGCLDFPVGVPQLLFEGDGYPSTAIVVEGDRAWVAGYGAIRVYDLGDPLSPIPLGTLPITGYVSDLTVVDGSLVIGIGGYGLRIASLTAGPVPVLVGALPFPGGASDVVIADGLAIVAAGTGGLVICDISDPAQPQVTATLSEAAGALAVVRHGNWAFVGCRASGILPVDVTNPALPVAGTMLDVGHDVIGLIVHDGFLYASTYDAQLLALDIAVPAAPVLAGTVELPDFATSLSGRDGGLWLSVCNTGLMAVDTTAPLAPVVSDLVELPGISYDCVLAGNIAFVAGSDELRVVDIGQPVASATLGWYLAPSGFSDFAVSGNRAYGLDYFEGLLSLDVTDPLHPVELSRLPLTGDPATITLAGDHAFVAARVAGLHVIDLADPDQPTLAVTLPFNGYVTYAALAGTRLIASVSGGIPDQVVVLDVADWRTPTVLGSVNVPSPGDIAIDGDRALVSRHGGVCLVGFVQPAAPVVLGTWLNDDLASGLVLTGDLAYVGSFEDGLSVLDLADPAHPSVVAWRPRAPFSGQLLLAGDVLYSASGDNDIMAFDVRDPAQPVLLGTAGLAGYTERLVLADGTLFATTVEKGLVMTQPACLTTAADVTMPTVSVPVLSASPNPFNPRTTISFSLDTEAEVAVAIVDVRGRHVRTLLTSTRLGPGTHRQVWDGCDDAGRPLAAGLYLANLRHGGNRELVKLTLLK